VQPQHISAAGVIVGGYYNGTTEYGFMYPAAGNQAFLNLAAPTLSGYGGLSTVALDTNSRGSIIGVVSYASDSSQHSFLYTPDGSYTVIDPPGASSAPARINSLGQIAGTFLDNTSVSHGYLRNLDGTFTTLDEPETVPASGHGTFVTSMNDAGAVTGYFYDAQNACHGFIRTP
jgi:hypothetical protein